MAEGNVEGAGGGSGNAGVWIDNASHTHINGTIGSNSGWDVGAVNNAWGWFNGTSWDGSQPFTYVDGSSTLNIQNPNNPQKAVTQLQTTAGSLNPSGNKESVPGLQELLRDWSERYRQDPAQAVEWLKSEASAMSMDLKSVANILLMDYHLAKGNFETVNDLIANTVAENNAYLIPGTVALRQLQLALNGPFNEKLARESLEKLRVSGLEEDYMLDRLALLVRERYGREDGTQNREVAEEPANGKLAEPTLLNYPNPFNPVTIIHYRLPVLSQVHLAIYDITGRRVATLFEGVQQAGEYDIAFDASELASGIYLYRIQAGKFVKTQKLTVIK